MTEPVYDTHYGIGLLDDIHNYFPALLYDTNQFESVQDVLEYIREQAMNRFNLFDRAEQRYISQGQRTQSSPQQPQQPIQQERARHQQSGIGLQFLRQINQRQGVPPQQIRTVSQQQRPREPHTNTTVLASQAYLVPPTTTTTTSSIPLDTSRMILQLLGIPTTHTTTATYDLNTDLFNSIFNDINLESVPIIPTQRQLQEGTEIIGATTSHESQICAVCQDRYAQGQTIRRIRSCGHEFHRGCIDTWFQRNALCPVCRHDIREAVVNRAVVTEETVPPNTN